jgi:hypothetical protein
MRFGKIEIFICLMIVVVTCSTFFLHDRLIVDDSTRQHIHRLGHHINRLENRINRINRLVPVNPAPDEELSKNKTGHKTKVLMRRSPAVQKVLFDLQVPKIAVAIPTHNRIGYVRLTSSALKGTFPSKDTWIFDDKSTEYSERDLMEWYGTEHVSQSKNRLKADAMARHILEWFLSTNYDVLVLLDSDLVVASDWVAELKLGLSESKGLLSLYRSAAPLHKSGQCSDVLCQQPSMGNAGTVWRRDLAKRMLSEMSARDGGFDWGWSEWCTKNKVPMEALKKSAVLHIGMYGSWSHESTAEKSVGFPMGELSAEVRERAENFLKGDKPVRIDVSPKKEKITWQSFPNVWLPTYYQMAYANPEARTANDLEKIKQTCIKLGCVAVTVEQNGWLAYFRNIPVDKNKWEPKPRSTMWVISKYLSGQEKQPDMKYGCSRHAHACRHDPEPGSAPCCAHVMLEIMSSMSRILRKHNIHWRLTQGQQLSVARDGIVQLWDHDFDPNFDQPEEAKVIIAKEMHLAGKASKHREADYYYTKRVAERLNTDWTKYKVMGGDFNWNLKFFHDPYALQRNPTFMDIGQNHDAKPSAETTFPCLPGHDILCSRQWFEETIAEFPSGYQRPPSGMPQEQIPYSGYVVGMNNLMFDENGQERDAQSRADTIRKYISACPNFWSESCLEIVGGQQTKEENILWVIPAFKRAWSLDLVLQSLASQTNILVSKDADSADIESVLKKYAVEAIEHPWSCSRHPNQFPAKDDTLNENYKGDTYGNPRSPWATCLKHHWWWMMKQAWARKPERVCVLEDDTVIHPQAFEWLDKNKEGNVKLTPEEIAVPWCMSAKEWQAIVPKTFCEHDDYNWDQTIAWMKEHGHGPNEAVVPSVSLSMHVGDCGGWDAGGRAAKCTPQKIDGIRANVVRWLAKPVAINTIKKKWLTAHSKPNGGWGHPKDWAHCQNNDLKIQYEAYSIPFPHFVRASDKENLIKNDGVTKLLDVSSDKLVGEIRIVNNGHYDVKDDCGYRANYDLHRTQKTKASHHYDVLVPLLVPSTESFQHFLDGSTPKIAQAWDVLQQYPNAKFLTKTSGIVRTMLTKMGVTNIVEWDGSNHYSADKLILICKTPPIHPLLMEKTQKLFGVERSHKGSKIILISRTAKNARNHGRIMLNEKKVYEYLKERFDNVVLFDNHAYSFDEALKLFQDAKIIIGGHGGGLYNIMFAPVSTRVIEIMPKSYFHGHTASNIFWALSSMVGQDYWRINADMVGANFNVDIQELITVLAPNQVQKTSPPIKTPALPPIPYIKNRYKAIWSKQPTERPKKTKILVLLQHLNSNFLNGGHIGFLGDILISSDLIIGLIKLGFDVKVSLKSQDEDWQQVEQYDIVIVDYDFLNDHAPTVKHIQKLVINDEFGTTEEYLHINGIDIKKQIWTMIPMPSNAFLGHVLQKHEKTIPSQKCGIISAKLKGYIQEWNSKWLQKIAEYIPLKGKFIDLPRGEQELHGVRFYNHGKLEYTEYEDLMRECTFVIGIGEPLIPISLEDAAASGRMVIQMKYESEVGRDSSHILQRAWANKPTSFKTKCQHPYLCSKQIGLALTLDKIDDAFKPDGAAWNVAEVNTLTEMSIPKYLARLENLVSDVLHLNNHMESQPQKVTLKEMSTPSWRNHAQTAREAIHQPLHIIIPLASRLTHIDDTVNALVRELPEAKVSVFLNDETVKWSNSKVSVIKYDSDAREKFRRTHPAAKSAAYDRYKPYKYMDEKNVKYTMDISYMMAAVEPGGLVMLIEDDFEACLGLSKVLHQMIYSISSLDTNWSMLRTGFGGNGLVWRGKDMPALSAYLARERNFRINDHLFMEWYHMESEESRAYNKGRLHAVGQHNLWLHRGVKSTWGFTHTKQYPSCFDPIYHVLATWETFDTSCEWVSPCRVRRTASIVQKKDQRAIQHNTLIENGQKILSHKRTLWCGMVQSGLNNVRVGYYHCLAIARYSKRRMLVQRSNPLVYLHTFPEDVDILDTIPSGKNIISLKTLLNDDEHVKIENGFWSSTFPWLRPVFPYTIEPLMPSRIVQEKISEIKKQLQIPPKYSCIHLRTHQKGKCWLHQHVPILDNDCPHMSADTFHTVTKTFQHVYLSMDTMDNYKPIERALKKAGASIYVQPGDKTRKDTDFNSALTSTVDMYICSGSERFIGHEGSSFSVEIYRHQKNALNYMGTKFECKTCHCLESGVCSNCDCEGHIFREKNISNNLGNRKDNIIKTSDQFAAIIPKQTADLQTIKTADLFAAIDYNAPENKGPWKQGWDYDYDGRFKDGLTVHVVPHSHNDPGWIQTYHTYYSTQTRHILDTVVAALTEDPRRTFIWAEISYFSLWWDDATQQQKEQAKKLVAEKRLDFVTGGWVMNDEASVTARATRWHLQEGREWLQNTFGITPQYSWAIDPFGHSAGQAQVLKELGYKGMLIQRVHYAVKKQLAQKQQLEFQWQTPAGDIFTHMMPFYSYDGPHTCGPDPSVCCQFDFARIGKGKTWTGCPWGKMAVEITEQNVAERSRTWLDQVYKKAMLYRGKHVLIPVGDDFRYQSMDEAHKQFANYQKMFDWIKVNVPAVKASFSTLTKYFDAQRQTEVPSLQGSFFPYSDREKDYWTGYFNSRIFYKGYDRLLESLIAAVETKCPTVDIHLQKRALGIFQHHDGITGTAKSAVVQDYYETMQKAVTELKLKLKTCLDIAGCVFVNPLSVDTPSMKADEIRPYEEGACVSVPTAGLQFENIKVDGHGRLLEINDTPVHESLVWRSNKPGQGVAGAYLMSVTSKEDILQPIKHTVCIAKRYKQLETTFDLLKRRIRVYNDGTIEFIYDVDIHARNNGELWAVYKPEWTAERLCSDVHGLTWECHTERKDAPLQAKFWPMPTMAWLASSSKRMTFTGAQPTGVGFHEGALVLMLDRRGNQDDARGLGQGITDSRPVEMRFGVLMETEGLKERASEKALLIRNWMLNPTIEIV